MKRIMITHLLFDLDNVLYSSRYGLENRVSERINDYLVEVLGMSRGEVGLVRKDVYKKYGTTIEWLIAEKGFTDLEPYFAAINPENEAESLPADPELGIFLSSISLPKAILTNSCAEHADRILNKLGIKKHFSHIFDIRFNNFKGKPRPEVFLRALHNMNAEPHIDEVDSPSGLPLKRIKNIQEISRFI